MCHLAVNLLTLNKRKDPRHLRAWQWNWHQMRVADESFSCRPYHHCYQLQTLFSQKFNHLINLWGYQSSVMFRQKRKKVTELRFIINNLQLTILSKLQFTNYMYCGWYLIGKINFENFFVPGVVAGELDEQAVMSRKSRTQVFSGRKLATSDGC